LFRYSTKRTAAELDYVEKITAQHKDFLYAKEVDGVGVGLFTKKRIPAASLVFHDMPYLLAPDIDSSKRGELCSHCATPLFSFGDLVRNTPRENASEVKELLDYFKSEIQPLTVTPCPECDEEIYCSETCRQQAWEQYHRVLCPHNKRGAPHQAKQALLAHLHDKDPLSPRDQTMALLMTRIYATIVSKFQMEISATKTTAQKALDIAWEPVVNLMAFPFAQVKTFNTILHLQKDFELISDALREHSSQIPELFTYDMFMRLYVRIQLNYLKTQSFSPLMQWILTEPPEIPEPPSSLNSPPETPSTTASSQQQGQGPVIDEIGKMKAKVSLDLAYKQLTYSILVDLQNQPNATSTPYFTNRLIGGGYAIFPLSSLLNHNCDPNLLPRYAVKGQLSWYSSKDIPSEEQLTIAYVDPGMSYESRSSFLKQKHFFQCKCLRCTNKE
jgi:hypothetical protein